MHPLCHSTCVETHYDMPDHRLSLLPPDHSTQQVAQLLMQCLAKSQAKQNFSNMDQNVLRQKYDEMQLKCQEFKVCRQASLVIQCPCTPVTQSLYKKCVKMIAMLDEQHKSEQAAMASNVQQAKKKDAATIEQLTRQNSGMEQLLRTCCHARQRHTIHQPSHRGDSPGAAA